jgi:hypothetical protein
MLIVPAERHSLELPNDKLATPPELHGVGRSYRYTQHAGRVIAVIYNNAE